jgi:exodeoxyribonuclease-3
MKKTTNQCHIVTWNVNSLRSRLQHVQDFIQKVQPDIMLLQELKLETEKFPYTEIEELGYNCAVVGQKTYNGVAILSKSPLEDICTSLYAEDENARYVEAVTYAQGQPLRVASVYVPNGQAMDSDKFTYKMHFMAQLATHMQQLLTLEEITVIGGDYNIAYLPHDVYDAKACEGEIGYNPQERAHMQRLLYQGYYDAFRIKYPDIHAYSWWDYRGGGLERDHGMRIDHLLLSPEATDKLDDCRIMKEVRQQDKPSDHAPVMATLQF